MKVDVLLGLQWGDEGKGKIVDVLSPSYDVVARFQGGPNAGHTLKFNNVKHVLHTVPSGIFRKNAINIVGNGVVIDPIIMKQETETLQNMGVPVQESLMISRKAHLILPTHRLLDAASELAKGNEKIGSTLKGIGPAYMDKTGRNGLRIGDIEMKDFRQRFEQLTEKHLGILKRFNHVSGQDLKTLTTSWMHAVDHLKSFRFIDSEHFLNDQIMKGKKVLAEGAQGALLDIDFGSYPYVTSSSTICAGACTGLGLPPSSIGQVFGIFKAYCTRVGSGPFPTELQDKTGEAIRKKGNEFGATTGRPRRCGWLDLPALKYSVMLNGVSKLFMMKADVLTGMKTIEVCTHYTYKGKKTDRIPFSMNHCDIKAHYQTFEGWSNIPDPASGNIPQQMKNYIEFIENELGVPIVMVSVGPDRTQTLNRIAT